MDERFAELKRLYRRLREMGGPELADRLRQQANARLDSLRYKIGIGFEPHALRDLSPPSQPNFFFSPTDVPHLCSRLRERFPTETDEIVHRAERICQGRFDLLGYRNLDFGQEIDWHFDPVHGKRISRKPFFQIPYLDFDEVGDSKIIWELNRHQHFVMLAKAYRITGDDKFVNELRHQWIRWHEENPYPIGINWASSLEVAFRSLSWLWMYFLIADSAAEPARFRQDLWSKLAVSARHIERYLSTYFSPNTHLVGEGTALFFIGTLCPELRRAERWQRRGWEILQQESDRQVRSDGFHFEQSTYYHVYAVDFFLHAAVLAAQNGIAIPLKFDRTLQRMLESLSILGRRGPVPNLGDDDGGRLFDPQRNRSVDLLDPLSAGAVLFSRGDFKSAAGGLREETLWLLGDAGVTEFDQLPTNPPEHNSAAFQASGLYVMTDEVSQLVIDAGPQGADTAGHGHADALSIVANRSGGPLLIDPGTFEYVGTAGDRNRFRGTGFHNTLVVDGCDQAEPNKAFSWTALPKVSAEGWITGENFDLFVGSHDGYTRLPDPVVHRRFVFSRKSRFWLVRDLALGRRQHRLELSWHISPGLSPVDGKNAMFSGEGRALSVLTPENHGWSQDISSEDWSPAYRQKEKCWVLRFSTEAKLPVEFVTLLLPEAKIDSGEQTFVRVESPAGDKSTCGYCFKTAGEEHSFVFGQGKPWMLRKWKSDAEFLYCASGQDKGHRILACCNVSHVEAGGRTILSSKRPVLRCEIVSIGGTVRVVSSDPDVVVDKEAFRGIAVGEDAKPVDYSPQSR